MVWSAYCDTLFNIIMIMRTLIIEAKLTWPF